MTLMLTLSRQLKVSSIKTVLQLDKRGPKPDIKGFIIYEQASHSPSPFKPKSI